MRKKKKWKTRCNHKEIWATWNSSKRLARESGFRSIKEVRRGRNCIKKIPTRAGIRAHASSQEDSQNKAREIGQWKISWLIITFWSWICWSIESLRVACFRERRKGFLPKLTHLRKGMWNECLAHCNHSLSSRSLLFFFFNVQTLNLVSKLMNVCKVLWCMLFAICRWDNIGGWIERLHKCKTREMT